MIATSRCEVCGVEMRQQRTGRPRRFCGPRGYCRNETAEQAEARREATGEGNRVDPEKCECGRPKSPRARGCPACRKLEAQQESFHWDGKRQRKRKPPRSREARLVLIREVAR